MRLIVNDKDITNLVLSLTWAGDIEERSRSVNFSYIYNDRVDMPLVEVKLGDSVNLFDDDKKLLFVGVVIDVSSSLKGFDVEINARDVLWYLGRNKIAGIYKGSSESIARNILGDFNLQAGYLESFGVEKIIISTGEKTIYEAIKEAYGDGYHIVANEQKVEVRKLASEVVAVISGKANLVDAKYKVSIESMVNRVIVVDDKGNRVLEVSDEKNLKFGILQEVTKAEKDKDNEKIAREKLVGIKDNSSIEVIGDLRVIAGKAIILKDTANKFVGKFLITSDSHSFSGGSHKMNLDIEVADE